MRLICWSKKRTICKIITFYQFHGGSSSGGLPDWRRVKLKKISNFQIREKYFKGKGAFPSGKHSSFDRRLAIVN
jgi:hypothetical protein